MSHDAPSNALTRRDLLKTGALAAGAAAVLPRPAAAQLKTVARNRTLSLVWIGSREGRWVDFELWNPYAIGSNHVLPTGGAARARGGLHASDYVRVVSVQRVTAAGLKRLAPTVRALARAEGLTAHARSITVRGV